MHADRRELREALSCYTQRSTPLAALILVIDIVIFCMSITGAIYFENLLLKVVAVVVASLAIAALFVVGHDAAHGAYTDSKFLNKLLGRIAFLPSLHNYSLWQIAHNRLHHSTPNLKGINSWSPLSPEEFGRLPLWRRWLEQLYRSPLGLPIYYLAERWWRDKSFPRRRTVKDFRWIYWLDFALLISFLAVWLAILGYAGNTWFDGVWSAVWWGFLLPFFGWNGAMGFAVWVQHTHPRIPWFRDFQEWQRLAERQERVTPYIVFPRWYGVITHDIMEHTAHHLAPKIPLYNLRLAQRRLVRLLGDQVVQDRFTLLGFLRAMADCKLYDYDRHYWCDFSGQRSSDCTLTGIAEVQNIEQAAVVPST
jgi:omega-6 fatty acid desaturase (delta-12 desaturase)